MTSYAAQKGRSVPVTPGPIPAKPRPLSDEEEAQVAANRDFILEHMPEMLEIIRDQHAAGNIDGWRSIKSCRMLTDD